MRPRSDSPLCSISMLDIDLAEASRTDTLKKHGFLRAGWSKTARRRVQGRGATGWWRPQPARSPTPVLNRYPLVQKYSRHRAQAACADRRHL